MSYQLNSTPPPYPGKTNGINNPAFDRGDEKYPEKNGTPEVVEEEEFDPWDLPELKDTGTPWEEMNCKERFVFVILVFLKITFFLGFLYIFICSLDFLSSAFRLLGGKTAGEVFRDNTLLTNPIAGVMIGVLATVLVQSSSTSTSIVVAMVGASILEVQTAIPIVMGANIGTSVTNTIVSLGQITDKADFRRAFAGATVHDMFNWLAVIVILPLEVITGYLYRLTGLILDSMSLEKYSDGKKDLLKAITKPFTVLIVQVDKKAIEKIAKKESDSATVKLLKECCKSAKNTTDPNNTFSYCIEECDYLFKNTSLSEEGVGGVLLFLSLLLLCICLFAIVKLLNSLLKGNIRKIIKKFVNAEFPGKAKYFTGYLAIIIGCGITILVQSSSIFTSALTPLVGIGVISMDRMYPLTLGANIGTTTTGILAALASDPESMRNPLQVAMCHLFFNLSGILLFYPIPFMRFPIPVAKFLGLETEKYRWFAIVYLILMFFLFPAAVFGLSLAGWKVMAGILIPIAAIIVIIGIIKVLQSKYPRVLPKLLHNWKFLPRPMRSLEPLDNIIQKIFICTKCCKSCRTQTTEQKPTKTPDYEMTHV